MYSITIQNVVASASLETEIPLEKIATTLENTEYNPEQFPGLVLRIKEPKVSTLIFSSGNIVCTGAKSSKMVKDAVDKIVTELRKTKIKIKDDTKIKIQNIVASGNFNINLNLDNLAFNLESAEYEPEQFPGLVYKVPDSHITFLLFGTGKFVCTGSKNKKELCTTVESLLKTLKKIKK